MSGRLSAALAEGFAWIEGFTNFERRTADSLRPFRLDRMRKLAAALGNPQESYRIVHVAGSKGKGSTCAGIGSILTEAGFTTGVYASPHVDSYRERFMLDGAFLEESFLLESIAAIRGLSSVPWFDDGSDPTTFELLTLTALTAFRLAGCDWVVLETGLGGRLDATNIVVPELSVITSIELEHTRILGTTLEEVAAEKGGIIKPGVPVLLGEIREPALSVLKNMAAEKNAPLYESSTAEISRTGGTGFRFILPSGRELEARPGMPGTHQERNALTAAWGADLLFSGAGGLDTGTIARGLAKAQLPGRFEVVPDGTRDWIYDAAHTPVSVAAAAETFRSRYPRGGVVILGIVADKDTAGIAGALPADLSGLIVTRPGSFKASNPEETCAIVSRRFPQAELCISAAEAVARAEETAAPGEPILVIGSFYLLGVIREYRTGNRETP